MCDPVTMTVATLAIGAAGAVADYRQGVANAETQNRLYENNKVAALKSQFETSAQTINANQQEDKARAEENQQIALQARADRASALVSAGENGVSGLSVSGLLAEFYQKEGDASSRLASEQKAANSQLSAELRGIQAQTDDRINSVQRASKPSKFAAALRIAGTGVDAYSGYKNSTKTGS